MKRIIMASVLSIFVLAGLAQFAAADEKAMGTCATKENCMSKCNMMMEHESMMSKMDFGDMLTTKIHFILANATEIVLTDDQIAKITALKFAVKKSIIKYDADIESLHLDIMEALMKDDIDAGAIGGLLDKKYAIKAAKAKDLVISYASLLKIITKDQHKKIKDMWMAGMAEHMKCDMKCEMKEEKEEHHMMHKTGMRKEE